VRPGRNGGTLKTGNPGNRGGPGRPRSAIRAAALRAFDERLPLLTAIADNDGQRAADRLKALALLARYGGLAQQDSLPDDLLRALAADVRAEVADGDTLRRIHGHWVSTLGEHIANNR